MCLPHTADPAAGVVHGSARQAAPGRDAIGSVTGFLPRHAAPAFAAPEMGRGPTGIAFAPRFEAAAASNRGRQTIALC